MLYQLSQVYIESTNNTPFKYNSKILNKRPRVLLVALLIFLIYINKFTVFTNIILY